MARETEVKVEQALEAIKKLQFQMAQVMSAISAMTEAQDAPQPVQNGKVRKAHR